MSAYIRETWLRYYRKGGGCVVDNEAILVTFFFFKLKTMGLIVVECFARQGLLEIKDLSSAVR